MHMLEASLFALAYHVKEKTGSQKDCDEILALATLSSCYEPILMADGRLVEDHENTIELHKMWQRRLHRARNIEIRRARMESRRRLDGAPRL
jgi:hypothetical protein